MANYRIPGPIGTVQHLLSIDDGTTGCFLPSPTGPVCSSSSVYPTKALLAPPEKEPDPDLLFLFRQCNNPARGISEGEYQAAAAKLKVEVAAIKAVAKVETRSDAFDNSGHPTILFERHKFHDQTAGKYDDKYSTISNAEAGGYGKYSAQYSRLEEAYNLDADAALKSASWGAFQIMGSNYKEAGYSSVKAFVFAMTRSESEHLRAFVNFVSSNNAMLKALRDKDWATFARYYNGKNYAANAYDTKMEQAYNSFMPVKG